MGSWGILKSRLNSAGPTPRHPGRKDTGITLIEVLMVVALIGVGAAIAVPMIEESRKEARNAQAAGDIRAIETDIACLK